MPVKIIRSWWLRSGFWRNQSGQDMVEYALVAGFLAVIAVAVMPQFSTTVSTLYSTVGRTINEALSAMGS